jgi:hypothetical protein
MAKRRKSKAPKRRKPKAPKRPKPKIPDRRKRKPPKRRKSGASSSSYLSEVIRWKDGDTTKSDPFFILILNNITFEQPLDSNNFVADMSTGSTADRALFRDSAQYVKESLFGEGGREEKLLADSIYADKIRVWSIYVWGLPINGASSFVGETIISGSDYLLPRRDAVKAMLAYLGLNPDIVFLVSNSSSVHYAHSLATTDDDMRGGIPATYGGQTIYHRYYHNYPGMSAINTRSRSDLMTAAHEFGHSFSSYTNGHIADLYHDNPLQGFQFNRKDGRPIPNDFTVYQSTTYLSDKTRGALGGYPATWTSYHPEPKNAAQPALMDNYHNTTLPKKCLHDKITKAYILDRIVAKVTR